MQRELPDSSRAILFAPINPTPGTLPVFFILISPALALYTVYARQPTLLPVPYFEARLTPEGRVAAEEPPIDINLCFGLMPFEAAFDPVYEAIKASAEDARMRCERADKARDNQAVIEKIKKSIQTAGLIVADMTGNNPNVFYEVGYAHGLGKECILTTQAASDEVPFDLRHLEHIKYSVRPEGLTELRTALTETIAQVRSRNL